MHPVRFAVFAALLGLTAAAQAQGTSELYSNVVSVRAGPSVLDVSQDAPVLYREARVLPAAHVAPEILSAAAAGEIVSIERAVSPAVLASEMFRGKGFERYFTITLTSTADAFAFYQEFEGSGLFESIEQSANLFTR